MSSRLVRGHAGGKAYQKFYLLCWFILCSYVKLFKDNDEVLIDQSIFKEG